MVILGTQTSPWEEGPGASACSAAFLALFGLRTSSSDGSTSTSSTICGRLIYSAIGVVVGSSDRTGCLVVGTWKTAFWDLLVWTPSLGLPLPLPLELEATLEFFPKRSKTSTGGAISNTAPVGMKLEQSVWGLGVEGWATYSTEGSTGVFWDLAIVGPSKKLLINGQYSSNTEAARGFPNSSTQMFDPSTLFISSTLAAESGIFSRAATAKPNKNYSSGRPRYIILQTKTYMSNYS